MFFCVITFHRNCPQVNLIKSGPNKTIYMKSDSIEVNGHKSILCFENRLKRGLALKISRTRNSPQNFPVDLEMQQQKSVMCKLCFFGTSEENSQYPKYCDSLSSVHWKHYCKSCEKKPFFTFIFCSLTSRSASRPRTIR